MKYKDLKHFLERKEGMKMQHVYQPLMIKTLLKSKDFTASVRAIAQTFLEQDEELVDYYANITRNMPGTILRRRGVVKFESNAFRLDIDSLNQDQIAGLVGICDRRLEEYYASKGGKREA